MREFTYDDFLNKVNTHIKNWNSVRFYVKPYGLDKIAYNIKITKDKFYADMKVFVDNKAFLEYYTYVRKLYICVNKTYVYTLEDYEGLWSTQNNVFKVNKMPYKPKTPQPTGNRKWTHRYD